MSQLNPEGVTINDLAKVRSSKFGKWTYVDERARVTESFMDDYSYILRDSEMIYTQVGKFCSIAPLARINATNHPMWRPSINNFTYRSQQYDLVDNDQDFFNWRRSQPVEIGHDVWVGQGVIILPGIKIGTGSILAASAVVTQDVPPYTIVGGIPAKIIGRRFPKEIEEALLRIEWWNWDHDTIKERMSDFRGEDINELCKKYDTK